MDNTDSSGRIGISISSAMATALIAALIASKAILVRLRIPPLRLDPCDAVGSFAVLTVALIAVASFLRRWRRDLETAGLRVVYELRSHQAVVLAAIATLVADAIALGRHPSWWVRNNGRGEMLVVLCVLAAVSVAAQFSILAVRRNLSQSTMSRPKRVAFVAGFAIMTLVACPDTWRSTAAHVFTVTLGALVLFLPMRLLLVEIVPTGYSGSENAFGAIRREWTLLMSGVLLGAFGFWAEAMKLGTVAGSSLVSAVLLVAYLCVAAPLGFTVSRRQAASSSTSKF